jgi:hypothetical protein
MEKNGKNYNCDICCFYANQLSDWNRHLITRKHKNSSVFNQKNTGEYECTLCDVLCKETFDIHNHILTAEHQKNVKFNPKKTGGEEITAETVKHKCDNCEKEYKSSNSLWYHKKKCITLKKENIIVENKIVTFTPAYDMISELLKQNNELQKQIIELCKEPKVVNNYSKCNTSINSNSTNTNNNNNQFNLNMFLNETCKDALNIDDFMDSLQLTVEDLEKTGELGFVQGITRIFLNGLKELEVSKRPIHCTDVKRETVYIKDQDKWEKESAEKTKMRQALNQAVRKNLGLIPAWREEHPDCLRSNTNDNDEYMKISMSSLGSEYEDEQERMNDKIIRNVLKEVVLDRKAGSQLSE